MTAENFRGRLERKERERLGVIEAKDGSQFVFRPYCVPCQDEEIEGFIVMLMEVLTGLTLIPIWQNI